MKRQILLTIVGVVWLLVGLLGVIGNETQNHGLQIPHTNYLIIPNYLIILAGVGLLKHSRLARWYVLYLSVLTFIVMLAFLPWALMNAGKIKITFQFPIMLFPDQRPHEPVGLALLVVVLMAYLVFSGWTFWVLSRADVRELFAKKFADARRTSTI
jgi:cytosine/uracil/thiamine/allantoin permease